MIPLDITKKELRVIQSMLLISKESYSRIKNEEKDPQKKTIAGLMEDVYQKIYDKIKNIH